MGTLRNIESARVSVPLTLKEDKDKGRCARDRDG